MNYFATRGLRIATMVAATVVAGSAGAQSKAWNNLGFGTPGTFGVPQLSATTPTIGRHLTLRVDAVPARTTVWFVIGLTRIDVPIFGGTVVPDPTIAIATSTSMFLSPSAQIRLRIPHACPLNVRLYVQVLVSDPTVSWGLSMSDALVAPVANDAPHDFNGDGLSDVVVGAPYEDIGSLADAGVIDVRYGGNALPQALLQQGADVNGLLRGTAEAGDRFGSVLAIGDFDGDGYDDLAVGVPRENSSNPVISEFGIVQVIYGSARGLQGGAVGRNDQVFQQGSNGIGDQPEDFDWFGKSLAAADFNGDGCDDLAIGAPYEDGAQVNQGRVHVLFGSTASGLTGNSSRIFDDPDTVEQDDRFGWNLASGDFNADGYFELVVGNPYQDIGLERDAGSVTILHPGFLIAGHTTLSQSGGSLALGGVSETFDLFGFSLAVGDFDNDGVDDVAIGVPFEDLQGASTQAAGAVNVVYGELGTGLVAAGNQVWHQDSAGITDSGELGDRFGYALAAADFDNDGACDLAVGVPRELLGIAGFRTGAVHLLYGVTGNRLTAAGNVLWHQGIAGSVNPAGDDDEFGFSLTTLDYDGDCVADLLVGAPGEDVGNATSAGGAHLFYGSPVGIGMLGNEFWDQGPLAGSPEAGDRLGASLAGSPDQVPL